VYELETSGRTRGSKMGTAEAATSLLTAPRQDKVGMSYPSRLAKANSRNRMVGGVLTVFGGRNPFQDFACLLYLPVNLRDDNTL
jgi:hypothetical protein